MKNKQSRLNNMYAFLVASREKEKIRFYRRKVGRKFLGLFDTKKMTPEDIAEEMVGAYKKHMEDSRELAVPLYYNLYLVNESEYAIDTATIEMGGFEGETEMNQTTKTLANLKPGTFAEIDTLDTGMLDFVLWHRLSLLFSDGYALDAEFMIMKAYALRKEIVGYSHTLGTAGYVFPLERASTPYISYHSPSPYPRDIFSHFS